ncbi:MAG: hypothetical protein HY767_00615 [Candidatus Omnitrophica bacterium]|nr:hypothetical protein [Candidatus Omnitrophota bacterium]
MPDRKLTPHPYTKLVADIASLYEGARRALVEADWAIGKRIVEVEQDGAIKAAYGTGLLPKRSEDLTRECGAGFSSDNLQKMRRFYLTNPKNATSRKLTWSHFTELLLVRDDKRRARLEKQAIEEGLTIQDVRRLIRQETVREEVARNLARKTSSVAAMPTPEVCKAATELLTPVRGTLYTYRILQPKLVGAEESELLIDLGFSCTKDLDNITGKTSSGRPRFRVQDPAMPPPPRPRLPRDQHAGREEGRRVREVAHQAGG